MPFRLDAFPPGCGLRQAGGRLRLSRHLSRAGARTRALRTCPSGGPDSMILPSIGLGSVTPCCLTRSCLTPSCLTRSCLSRGRSTRGRPTPGYAGSIAGRSFPSLRRWLGLPNFGFYATVDAAKRAIDGSNRASLLSRCRHRGQCRQERYDPRHLHHSIPTFHLDTFHLDGAAFPRMRFIPRECCGSTVAS